MAIAELEKDDYHELDDGRCVKPRGGDSSPGYPDQQTGSGSGFLSDVQGVYRRHGSPALATRKVLVQHELQSQQVPVQKHEQQQLPHRLAIL